MIAVMENIKRFSNNCNCGGSEAHGSLDGPTHLDAKLDGGLKFQV